MGIFGGNTTSGSADASWSTTSDSGISDSGGSNDGSASGGIERVGDDSPSYLSSETEETQDTNSAIPSSEALEGDIDSLDDPYSSDEQISTMELAEVSADDIDSLEDPYWASDEQSTNDVSDGKHSVATDQTSTEPVVAETIDSATPEQGVENEPEVRVALSPDSLTPLGWRGSSR